MVEDGYDWVSVRGEAVVNEDPEDGQADIAAMARLYHADEPDTAERLIENEFRRQRRVSFLLRPEAVASDLGG